MKKYLMMVCAVGFAVTLFAADDYYAFDLKGKAYQLPEGGGSPKPKIVQLKVNALVVIDDIESGSGWFITYEKGDFEVMNAELSDVDIVEGLGRGVFSAELETDGWITGVLRGFGGYSVKDDVLTKVSGRCVGIAEYEDSVDTCAELKVRFNKKLTQQLVGISNPDLEDVLAEYIAKKTKMAVIVVRGILEEKMW